MFSAPENSAPLEADIERERPASSIAAIHCISRCLVVSHNLKVNCCETRMLVCAEAAGTVTLRLEFWMRCSDSCRL
eukprot:3568601-Pleurochrysis_carterae.AAC.2